MHGFIRGKKNRFAIEWADSAYTPRTIKTVHRPYELLTLIPLKSVSKNKKSLSKTDFFK